MSRGRNNRHVEHPPAHLLTFLLGRSRVLGEEVGDSFLFSHLHVFQFLLFRWVGGWVGGLMACGGWVGRWVGGRTRTQRML